MTRPRPSYAVRVRGLPVLPLAAIGLAAGIVALAWRVKLTGASAPIREEVRKQNP